MSFDLGVYSFGNTPRTPNEVADRILHLHELLGHSRQTLQMDVGGVPQASFLKELDRT